MPNALRIGLPGPLQERDETGRPVRVGGRQLRVLLTLLALDAGRVVPSGSLAGLPAIRSPLTSFVGRVLRLSPAGASSRT